MGDLFEMGLDQREGFFDRVGIGETWWEVKELRVNLFDYPFENFCCQIWHKMADIDFS